MSKMTNSLIVNTVDIPGMIHRIRISIIRLKCAILLLEFRRVLISLPKALSPWVVIPLLSVTHGQ